MTLSEIKRLVLESEADDFKVIVKQAYPWTDRATRKMIVDLYTSEGWYPKTVQELKADLPDIIQMRCDPNKAKVLLKAIEEPAFEPGKYGYGVFFRGELQKKFKSWENAEKWADEKYNLETCGDEVTIDPLDEEDVEPVETPSETVDEEQILVTEGHSWDDFDKFDKVFGDYLPNMGEGETMASQIATAVCKIVYKWFNDGDVYDNTVNGIETYNDLSSYANWLYKYVPESRYILARIWDYEFTDFDDYYTNLLYNLCDGLSDVIEKYKDREKQDSVYSCEGQFKCEEPEEDEEEY